MSKITITYYLSEEGRKKSLLAGGDGKRTQVIEADITPELLKLARVLDDGTIHWKVDSYILPSAAKTHIEGTYDFSWARLDGISNGFYENHRPKIVTGTEREEVVFDEPQTVQSLLDFWARAQEKISIAQEAMDEKVKELETILPKKIAAWEKAVEEHKRKASEYEQRKRDEADKAAREKEAREAEKAAWISTYGSDYLKRAVKLGYNCQRQYVTERVAMEFPEYTLDFENAADWNDRSCPSIKALNEVESLLEQGYDAEVIWLTYDPASCASCEDDEDNEDGWGEETPCEAILIRNYLGKYKLIKKFPDFNPEE